VVGGYIVLPTLQPLRKAYLGGAFEQELTALCLILHFQQLIIGSVEIAVNVVIKVQIQEVNEDFIKMAGLYAPEAIEVGGVGTMGVGEFELLEGENEIGVGEAEGSEELPVVVVNGCVELPPDLVLHHVVLVYAAAHVVVLVGVVTRNQRQLNG
jgi:hypothetical protein